MSLLNKPVSVFPAILAGVVIASVALGQEAHKISPIGLSLTVGVKQTDNRDTIPDGYLIPVNGVDTPQEKEDDTELWITPTISFFHETGGGHRLQLSYKPSYTAYDNPRDGGVDNELSHEARAALLLFIGPRTQVDFTDRYWWNGAKDWHYGEEYILEHPEEFADDSIDTRNDDYYNNHLDLAINRIVTADLSLKLGALWRIKRYDDEEIAAFGDEDEYGLSAALVTRQNRHLSYGVFTEYTAFDRNNGEDFEADPTSSSGTPRIDVGVQYIVTGVQASYDLFGNQNVILSARTGYNFMTYEADAMEDSDSFGDSVVELILFQQERTSGRFGLRYGKEYANIYPYSSQDNTTLFGSVSRIIGRSSKLRVGADAEFRTRTYELDDLDPDAANYSRYFENLFEKLGPDGEGKRDSTFARLHANYRWTDDFSTSVFYTYEDVDSDVDNDYTENTIGLSATYKFL